MNLLLISGLGFVTKINTKNIYESTRTEHIYYGEDAAKQCAIAHPKQKLYYKAIANLHGKDMNDVFVEYKTPIFVYQYPSRNSWRQHVEFVINPCLKDLEFFKMFDAFTANQMIQQYIMNDLAKQDDPEPLDDKYRVLAHGMDETSFRRDKGGPTRKRKKLKGTAV